MSTRKHAEADLRAYLLSHAPIDAFYVTCFGKSGSGLINYFDSDGKAWCLMEDDDTLVSDALAFLKESGAPFFFEPSEAQKFEANRRK